MFSAIRKTRALLLTLLLTTAAFAQPTNSTLMVRVVDQNGNLIPNFAARLRKERKVEREIVSDSAREAVFAKIAPGKYVLEIEAKGFKPRASEIEINAGANELTVVLEIAEIVENVNVEPSRQEQAIENGFSNFLTESQIAALPDDPREMEAELKRLAGGDNVIIRVDGFTGGRLPSKSQIASVRIVRSSYDAENHELGAIFVDVVTKVGSHRWDGSASFTFNDEALNARNAFSPGRFPEQNRNAFLFLSGPIRENKTDFSLLLYDNRDFRAQTIVAFLPSGAFHDSVSRRSRNSYLDLNVNHNLTKKLPVKIRYNFSDLDSENLGVGGFNLPERAFSIKNRVHELRFSTAGNFAKRFLNEFRFQYQNEFSMNAPQNDSTAIIVLDSFSRGGAGNLQKNSRQSFWLADNLLFGVEKHALKIGGALSVEKQTQTSALNQNGTFIFSNVQDFQNGRPAIFSQSPDRRRADASQIQADVFVQDDVRLAKSFVLSFGVRYEWQNNLRDFNNFSPRLAFSWSPDPEGKTTLRGGIGIFYQRLNTDALLAVASQDETQPGETIIFNPGFPNPLAGGAIQILPPSFLQKAFDLKNPEILHASFGVQRRISNASQVRFEYVYQKGTHQFRSRDLNAPLGGVRPKPNFGRIAQIESSAFFVRHALNIGYNGSLTRKISFMLDYTLANTISDSGGIFSLPGDNYNLRAERSAADNDQRHRLSGFLSWQIRKGLRVSAIYTARSPLPYTITTGRDDNRDAVFNDRPFGVGRNRERGAWRNQFDLSASYIFSFVTRKNNNSGKSFSIVTTAAESNSGFDMTDAEKRFSLRFFANVENLFNQTNLTSFVGVETSPFFRQATAAGQARKISLGVRFNF
jgi:hypothetical protein